jgi:hypothetical protein
MSTGCAIVGFASDRNTLRIGQGLKKEQQREQTSKPHPARGDELLLNEE